MEIDLLFQILHELKAVGQPDRVDEDGLFLLDEIGVLAGAVFDGVILTVEPLQLPIDITHPTDVSFYVLSHGVPLVQCWQQGNFEAAAHVHDLAFLVGQQIFQGECLVAL